MRDQHFAAAIGDDLDLFALDRGRELARHPDFRRRHHALLDFDQPAAARFMKSQPAAAAGFEPDARAIAELGRRRLDKGCGIQLQAKRTIERRRDDLALNRACAG